MQAFNLDRVLDDLDQREIERSRQAIPVAKNELRSNLCERKNPYAALYPDAVITDPEATTDTVNFFERPDYYTYYRIEPAKASEYYQVHKTVLVFLTTDENYLKDKASFREYFGVSARELARRVKHGDILPLMGPADRYKIGNARDAYTPFFDELRPDVINRRHPFRGPFYANRLEDSLARQYHNGRAWQELKDEEIENVRPKEGGPIVLHSLKHRDARAYYGERIAWLKLLGWDAAAELVKTVAQQEPKDAASLVAHVIHNLVTAPVFYARKGLHSIYVPTEFQDYRKCVRILKKISNEYNLPRKSLPPHIASASAVITTLLRNLLRPAPDQDSVKPMTHFMVKPTSDQESRDVWAYFNEEGLFQQREEATRQKVSQGRFLLQPSGDIQRAVAAAYHYRKSAEAINSSIAGYSANRGSKYLEYSLPVGGIFIGATLSLLPENWEARHLFIEAYKQACEDPTPLLDTILSKATQPIREDAERKAREFNFLPPLMLWDKGTKPMQVKWGRNGQTCDRNVPVH